MTEIAPTHLTGSYYVQTNGVQMLENPDAIALQKFRGDEEKYRACVRAVFGLLGRGSDGHYDRLPARAA